MLCSVARRDIFNRSNQCLTFKTSLVAMLLLLFGVAAGLFKSVIFHVLEQQFVFVSSLQNIMGHFKRILKKEK